MSGLWSGHRTTARDNTILHAAYQQVVLSSVRRWQPMLPVRSFMCGDDEDTLFSSLVDAQTYAYWHMACGWHLNPSKQMLGTGRHEFLQWLASGSSISKPLASMVATLTMGNWYKPKVLEVASLPAAAADQAVSLCSRGALPEHVAIVMQWLLASAFRLTEVRTAHPIAIVIPPRSGKTTLVQRYGLTDIDATRSWLDTNLDAQSHRSSKFFPGINMGLAAAAEADPTIPLLAWGPAAVPEGRKIYAIVLEREAYASVIEHHATQGRQRVFWDSYRNCAAVPGCRVVVEQSSIETAMLDIFSQAGATMHRRYYDWRTVLGESHPAVEGAPQFSLANIPEAQALLKLPHGATSDYITTQLVWQPTPSDQQLIMRQRLNQNFSSVLREHRNSENRALMALLPTVDEPPEFRWKDSWPRLSSAMGVQLLSSMLDEPRITTYHDKCSRVGIDPVLVKHAWSGYHLASAHSRQHYPLNDDQPTIQDTLRGKALG